MFKIVPAVAVLATTLAAGAPALAQQGQAQGKEQQRQDYIGTFQPMNGSSMTGMVAFKSANGQLIASLGAADVPKGMHMAHIHGFTGKIRTTPPAPPTRPTPTGTGSST